MNTKWNVVLLALFASAIAITGSKQLHAALPCHHRISIYQDTMADKIIEVGDMAPAFSVPDLYGKKVSLAGFRGRYVLLDFWASWCAPCRQSNPGLVKLYNKFKSPQFEMIGISIDTDRSSWYRAFKNDGLPWLNLCELIDVQQAKGVVLRYVTGEADGKMVVFVPQNYLVDPTGKVIAKNLHGEELEAVLKKILSDHK